MDELFAEIVRNFFHFLMLVNDHLPLVSSIFFLFSGWIIELNSSPPIEITEAIRLRLNNLLNLSSSVILNNGTNEEYIRICLPCSKFLQRNYDRMRFKNIEKDAIFEHFEVIDIEELTSDRIFSY
jgi:hypothetical protein